MNGPRAAAIALTAVCLLAGCGRRGGGDTASSPAASPAVPEATPVTVAKVERRTLHRTVTASGRTIALVEQKIRAPFDGTVDELDVVVGDHVTAGQQVGSIVSRESEAALRGAREMLRQADGAAARADAERAVELARRNLVAAPLEASASGVVVVRDASAGDRVAQNQELLTLSAADSIVFRAEIAQSDLPDLRSGERVRIDLTGRDQVASGVVRGILAGAETSDVTAPYRIDFAPPLDGLWPGLFGHARISVEEHRDVPAVPAEAVLTDDVSGVSRLGLVTGEARVHWVEVETGLTDGGWAEILTPRLDPGSRVVVSGQVGLPEGARVMARPAGA